jgi:cell division protease FtsH
MLDPTLLRPERFGRQGLTGRTGAARTPLLGKIEVPCAGRAAEHLVLGALSIGAHDDLRRATAIARAMALEYGMGAMLGPATFPQERRPVLRG